MYLTERPGEETLLTITPIVGWRRWIVTPRRRWEEGSGPVLRGAWGRAWTTGRLTARCLRAPTGSDVMGEFLDSLEARRHREPAPSPGCVCGVYAEKVDSIDTSRNPRLAGRPTVAGFVEMSGRVLEGTTGYRARHAAIVAPLEMDVPCGGADSGFVESCTHPATTVLTRADVVRGACEEHASSHQDFDALGLTAWVDRVLPQLEANYDTPILYIERESKWTSAR